MKPLIALLLPAVIATAAPVFISAGRVRLELDPERGGVPAALWFDLNRDGAFSADEKMLDTASGQGLVLEILATPAGRPAAESWYPGETYRLRALADDVKVEAPNRAVVTGRFFRAGIWPYRLEWEITGQGVVRGAFQLLDGRREHAPSQVVALGLDLRFHYRDAAGFHRRAVHAAVDRRIWELPAETVRWWSGRRTYDASPQTFGYSREEEVPWPDFNVVAMVQGAAADCRLWKATAADAGSLTHWRGARSRGWMHVEDRRWGLAYGMADMARNAPGSLAADLDTGDLTGGLSIAFWPRQARRLDPRGPDAPRITQPYTFFLAPNEGRWNDAQAAALDGLGGGSGSLADVEPDPESERFAPVKDLPPVAARGVAFRIDEPAGVARRAWPVTVGVPLRQGEVQSAGELRLRGPDGRPVAVQAERLAYWPDRSVKWALLDAQVDLPKGTGAVFTAGKGGEAPRPAARATASRTAAGVRVETGPLAFEVNRGGSGFIDRAWLNGELVVGEDAARRSILDYVRTDRYQTGDHSIGGTLDEARVKVTEVEIETPGPLRVVVRVRGSYANRQESPFTLRLEAYAGKPWVRVQHTFICTMEPDREFLRALGLRLPLRMSGQTRATFSGTAMPDDLRWGALVEESLDQAAVWGAAQPGSPARQVAAETRSAGWADISSGRWGLTIAVQNFWREFAKGIEIDRAAHTATAWFWPPEAPPLDLRRYSRWMHPQVGESVASTRFSELRSIGSATGLAKTSEAMLVFHGGSFRPEEAAAEARAFDARPVALANPKYYEEAGLSLAGTFAPYDPADYPELERTYTDIADYFLFNRRRFSWYGMIDYGDIGHMSRPAIRLDDGAPYQFRDGWAYDIGRWGWTNTEGADALGYMLAYFRTGYRPYFDASAIAARHNRDVDIFHWGPQKYQGHTRHNVNHWGDGDTEIRISQPTPNRFYYYLTGDPRSRDVIEGVVDELYLKHTIRHNADLGAVLYGFLVRWEMTGDEVWRNRAIGIAHAYGDYMAPNGALPHMGVAIEAATGRRLGDTRPAAADDGLFFLHGFGAIHAMIELEELTGDPGLAATLYKHAVHCSQIAPGPDLYLLLLAYEYARTGEQQFADRILVNLGGYGMMGGVYPRDRKYWTGVWGEAVEQGRGRLGGTVPNVHDIYTSVVGYAWNPLPSVLRALRAHGIPESRVPRK